MNAIISLINQQLYAPNQKLNTVISIKCWDSIKYAHYALFRWIVWNKPRLFILKIPDGKWVFHSKFKTLQTFEWSQINCHFFDYVTTQNNISCVFDYILGILSKKSQFCFGNSAAEMLWFENDSVMEKYASDRITITDRLHSQWKHIRLSC